MTEVRVTQVALESIVLLDPNARITTVAAETLILLDPNGRVSEVALEVLSQIPTFIPQIYRRL